jgi:hypothetical protein
MAGTLPAIAHFFSSSRFVERYRGARSNSLTAESLTAES